MSDVIQTTQELEVLKVGGAIDQRLYTKAKKMLDRGTKVIYIYSARRKTRTRLFGFKVDNITPESY
jgi:hypothetical protein